MTKRPPSKRKHSAAIEYLRNKTFSLRQELKLARKNPISDLGMEKLASVRRDRIAADVKAFLNGGGRFRDSNPAAMALATIGSRGIEIRHSPPSRAERAVPGVDGKPPPLAETAVFPRAHGAVDSDDVWH